MAKLIDELKKDHYMIVDMLSEINRLGISSKEGAYKLTTAKAGFLAHLKKEDEKLYPVLRRAAQTDNGLKQSVDAFETDMKAISRDVMQFFDKYAQGGSGIEFAKDFGRLFASLKTRIRKEEVSLYPAFEKISN